MSDMHDLRQMMEDTGDTGGSRYVPVSFRPIHAVATRTRFIRGEYGPEKSQMVVLTKHYNRQTNKYQTCSSLWHRDPVTGKRVRVRVTEADEGHRCVGCFLQYDNHPSTGIPARPVTTSHYYTFSIYVMANFHLDPNNKDGKPLGVNEEGQPKYRRLMCTQNPQVCEGCMKGLPIEYGRRMRWEIAKKYLLVLLDYVKAAALDCANCGAAHSGEEGDRTSGLAASTLICSHCGRPIPSSDPKKVVEIIEDKTAVKCEACGAVMVPQEHLVCANCSTPKRPTLYDMDFWVKKASERKTSDVVVMKYKVGRPHEKVPQDQLRPLDLYETLLPEDLESQLQIHDVPSPWVAQANRQYTPAQPYAAQAQPYGQPNVPAESAPPSGPAPAKSGDDGL